MLSNLLKHFLVGTLLLVVNFKTQCQSEADKLFAKKNFQAAYNEYSTIDNNDLSTQQIYNMAVCVLNVVSMDKKQAETLLHSFIEKNPNDGNAHYLLGRSLAYQNKFDEAEKEFTYCLTAKNITSENKNDAGHELEYCQNARAISAYTVMVNFEVLTTEINSSYDDYFPFTDQSESVLYFNSRRNGLSIEKENGEFTSDIYYSKVVDGKFIKAIPITGGNINNPKTDEEIVGLSADGKKAIICFEDASGNTDLKIANLKDGKIVSLEKLPKGVNTPAHEIAATFGTTTNEIYFASNRSGGFGGIDIYVIRKDMKGKWALPQNLGPEINTIYDEDFPNLSHDGQYLFFSSKGHASIGGYDIFKAGWDDNLKRFVKPVNVGVPVNTLYDDMNLNFSGSERYGYVSRSAFKNEMEINRITFEEVEPELSIITGTVETGKKTDELLEGILMVVENVRTGEISGEYLPNPNTMRYVMALSPGVYKVSIDIEGFEEYAETFEIKGKASFEPQTEKNFTLKRK